MAQEWTVGSKPTEEVDGASVSCMSGTSSNGADAAAPSNSAFDPGEYTLCGPNGTNSTLRMSDQTGRREGLFIDSTTGGTKLISTLNQERNILFTVHQWMKLVGDTKVNPYVYAFKFVESSESDVPKESWLSANPPQLTALQSYHSLTELFTLGNDQNKLWFSEDAGDATAKRCLSEDDYAKYSSGSGNLKCVYLKSVIGGTKQYFGLTSYLPQQTLHVTDKDHAVLLTFST